MNNSLKSAFATAVVVTAWAAGPVSAYAQTAAPAAPAQQGGMMEGHGGMQGHGDMMQGHGDMKNMMTQMSQMMETCNGMMKDAAKDHKPGTHQEMMKPGNKS